MTVPVTQAPAGWRQRISLWGSVVRFSHSVFALPFALSQLAVIWRDSPVSAWQIFWIVIAIVSARTSAMACNRLLDRDIDARNPRTVNRELPRRAVTPGAVRNLLIGSAVIFLLSAGALGTHCLYLAPFVLAWLCFYSYTKRFTRYSHLVLGASLAAAPGGVWYALKASVALEPLVLMAGVACWVAGFDILYSCQDTEFDRKNSLFSIPAAFGIQAAFRVSLSLHIAAVAFLCWFGMLASLGPFFFGGMVLFSAVLFTQHRIVRPDDLSRIDAAFFTRNGVASILFFAAVVAAVAAGTS